MDFDDAFGSDVSPREFFEEKLRDLFESRLDRFDRLSDTPIRASVHLTDLDQRYSFEFDSEGLRSTEGEFIDFPVVTVEGSSEQWETVREHTRELLERIEARTRHRTPDNRITRRFLDELERHDGVFTLEIATEERDEPVVIQLILNDYQAPPRAREVEMSCSADLLYDVANGDRTPAEAARSASLSGDLSLAFDIGGLLMSHFPELDD